jgi:hypothetical protein
LPLPGDLSVSPRPSSPLSQSRFQCDWTLPLFCLFDILTTAAFFLLLFPDRLQLTGNNNCNNEKIVLSQIGFFGIAKKSKQ